MRIPQFLVLAGLMGLAAASTVSAQQKNQVLGPNECLNCHDHDAERQWYREEGDS